MVRAIVKATVTKLKNERFQNERAHALNSGHIVAKTDLGFKQSVFQDLETRKPHTHTTRGESQPFLMNAKRCYTKNRGAFFDTLKKVAVSALVSM